MIIEVEIDGEVISVPRNGYVTNTLKRMRAFGYPDLTKQEVEDSVEAALSGVGKSDVVSVWVAGEILTKRDILENLGER